MDQDTIAEGINVVVKRKGEIYEEGMVRYFGYLTGELVIGIELAMQSENVLLQYFITVLYYYSIITVLYYIQYYYSTIILYYIQYYYSTLLHTVLLQYFAYLIYFIIELYTLGTDSQGANNDGVYKDNKRYFVS